MLSVIASGDQIFNAVLAGIMDIDGFDITRFAKYFFYLKKAAIQGLTKKEYIDFFLNTSLRSHEEKFYYNIYADKIRPYLEAPALPFWDALFEMYAWRRIQRSISRGYDFEDNMQRRNNKYLADAKIYQELRDRLKDTRMSFKTGDIMDLYKSYSDEYDIIYLSNIHQYIGLYNFKNIANTLKLTPEGALIVGFYYSDFSPSSFCDIDLYDLRGQTYKFSKYAGYITGRRR
jgi:hypothetical protein